MTRPGTMNSGITAEIKVPGLAARLRSRRYLTSGLTMLRYGLGTTTREIRSLLLPIVSPADPAVPGRRRCESQ